MDFFKVVDLRRSMRAFLPRQVEEDSLSKILEAANQAPSAGNLQAYEVYLVQDRRVLHKLARAALDQDFIAEAAIVLVFCSNPARSKGKYGERGESLYSLQDATISCTFAMLAATALGLGSVWVGAFHEQAVRDAIGAHEGHNPLALLAIGHSAENPVKTNRRDLKDLVHEV